MRRLLFILITIAALGLLNACDTGVFKSSENKDNKNASDIKKIEPPAATINDVLSSNDQLSSKLNDNTMLLNKVLGDVDSVNNKLETGIGNIQTKIDQSAQKTTADLKEKIAELETTVNKIKNDNSALITITGAGFLSVLVLMAILIFTVHKTVKGAVNRPEPEFTKQNDNENTNEQKESIPDKYSSIISNIRDKEEKFNMLIDENYELFEETAISARPLKKHKDAAEDILEASAQLANLGIKIDSKISYIEALSSFYKKEYDKALEKLDNILSNNSEDFLSYNLQGFIHSISKDYEKAITSFEGVTKQTPNNHFAYSNLALSQIKIKNFEGAADSLRKSLVIKPNDATGWNSLANVLNMGGKAEDAVKAYQKAIEINPELHEALHNLGTVFYQQKEYSKAIEAYEKAVDIKHDKVESIYNTACSQALLGEKEKALESLKNAVDLKPEYAEKASKDADFSSLFDSEEFKKIVTAA